MRVKKLSRLWLLPLIIFQFTAPAFAASKIDISVKTVLAAQDAAYVDPRLKDLAKELKTVFRYTSYRLLGENRIRLELKKTGTISLPGNRVLKVTPVRISGNRAELNLAILKGNSQIFNTSIQLLNRGSITIGGPRHKNGFLLLNIFNSF
jgi:hypothetical protein